MISATEVQLKYHKKKKTSEEADELTEKQNIDHVIVCSGECVHTYMGRMCLAEFLSIYGKLAHKRFKGIQSIA